MGHLAEWQDVPIDAWGEASPLYKICKMNFGEEGAKLIEVKKSPELKIIVLKCVVVCYRKIVDSWLAKERASGEIKTNECVVCLRSDSFGVREGRKVPKTGD